MPAIALQPAGADLDYVERLLAAAELPTDDVRSGTASFYVGVEEGSGDVDDESAEESERVGVGGIEEYGRAGLLRSVVVEPEFRGEGYGAALTAALETRARADGIESLSLLTTTAADFFESQGYERIERGDAPDAIQETTQFAQLCPDSAVCMRKTVAAD